MSALLELRGLTIELATPAGNVRAVEGLDLAVRAGETLALVGESGCGKTLTAQAVLGVLPAAARVVAGEILWRGRDLLALPPEERRALGGRELALAFQEPLSALDPVQRVGEQIAEGLRVHERATRAAAWERALALLAEVGLTQAEERARRLPHELSGGQRQRVMLALALAARPALLIADEPTSALDLPAQAEVLALLARCAAEREMALVLISHDLAVVSELAERVVVMYAGRVVEEGDVFALFERPSHPYTVGLLRARASTMLGIEGGAAGRSAAIPGNVPAVGRWPSGCRFHPRCFLADERCRHEEPRLLPAPGPRSAAPEAPEAPEAPALRAPDPLLGVVEQRVACHHAGEAARS